MVPVPPLQCHDTIAERLPLQILGEECDKSESSIYIKKTNRTADKNKYLTATACVTFFEVNQLIFAKSPFHYIFENVDILVTGAQW